MPASGRSFYKMSGSGNDFVIFDARTEPAGDLEQVSRIEALCARGTGVGADGVVFLEHSKRADYRMRYFNSDGSKAAICGNASLCTASLALRLGMVGPEGWSFETDTSLLKGRVREGQPEIDFDPVTVAQPEVAVDRAVGERRLGYGVAGNPHFVARCDDLESVDIDRRGPELRWHPSAVGGANVNWVARDAKGWAIRTFERGVEAETLACGSGSVASAVLLNLWGEVSGSVALRTRSGRTLTVTLEKSGEVWLPSLRGEGRLVFEGQLQNFAGDP